MNLWCCFQINSKVPLRRDPLSSPALIDKLYSMIINAAVSSISSCCLECVLLVPAKDRFVHIHLKVLYFIPFTSHSPVQSEHDTR